MKNYTIKASFVGLFSLMIIFSACNKEKYTLEYNFSPGDSFKQHIEVETNINQNFKGQEVNISGEIFTNVSFTIKEVDNNGEFSMEMTYEKMKMDMDMGMMQISLDSDTDNNIATPEDMSPIFKSLIGVPIVFTMDKKGNVSSFGGFDKLLESMTNAIQSDMDEFTKQQMLASLDEQLSEESLYSMFNNIFSYFPQDRDEVSIGDNWSIEMKVNNQGMSLSSVLNITLESVKDNIATLTCKGDITTPEGGIVREMNGTPATINMKGTMEGTVLIDMANGITSKLDMVQNLEGATNVMGMEIPQKITNKIKATK